MIKHNDELQSGDAVSTPADARMDWVTPAITVLARDTVESGRSVYPEAVGLTTFSVS